MVSSFGNVSWQRFSGGLLLHCGALAVATIGVVGMKSQPTRAASFDDYSTEPMVSVLQTDDGSGGDPTLDLGVPVPESSAPAEAPLDGDAAEGQPAAEEISDEGATAFEISDLPPNSGFFGNVLPSSPAGLLQRLQEKRSACWAVRTEAIALWRNSPTSRPLFTTYDPLTNALGPTVLDASQSVSDPLAAPRVTVSRIDACGRGIEATYLYAGNFYSANSLPFVENGYAVAAPGIYGNLWGAGPGPTSGTPISAVQQSLTSNLNSAEINLREPIGWGSTRFLAGFRWLQWWETWSMTDQFIDPTDPTITGSDSYSTRCVNNLYGGQIGLDSVLWNTGKGLRLESVVKAGAYYNASSQSSAYSYSSTAPFGFDRAVFVGSPGSASFVGEVGLTAVVPLRRNLDLRCGYFGLWLDSIAQPTNQLSGQTLTQFNDSAGTIKTNGGLVLQGVSLGLEGRW